MTSIPRARAQLPHLPLVVNYHPPRQRDFQSGQSITTGRHVSWSRTVRPAGASSDRERLLYPVSDLPEPSRQRMNEARAGHITVTHPSRNIARGTVASIYSPEFPVRLSDGETVDDALRRGTDTLALQVEGPASLPLSHDCSPEHSGLTPRTSDANREQRALSLRGNGRHNQASNPWSGCIRRRNSSTGRHQTPSIRSCSRPR